jgi:hypothetical protein
LKELQLSRDLALPLDAVTQKLAWLGRTGSGKTYGASKLAEEMIAADAQVVILDAVGVWYGLRLAADGKGKGIEIPVFGGLHGDVPLEPTGGALMANLVVDRGISVVIDVSQFETDAAKARFAHEWGDRFFFRKKAAPSAVHVFIEECQEFVPQNPQKGEERMLHAFQRIEKLGRNFGIGVSLISQRPQEVNKKALNQTECLFVFQMTGTQERKAIEAWIADKDLDEDVGDMLPHLEIGQAHVWSPQWLKVSKSVRIAKKHTFNASSTPTVGGRAAAHQLAPIDLDRIRQDMAATIERAKAEDPRELQKTVRELRAQLVKKEQVLAEVDVRTKRIEAGLDRVKPPRVVEKPILKEAHVKRLEAAAAQAVKAAERWVEDSREHYQTALNRQAEVLKKADEILAALAAARSGGGHVESAAPGAGRKSEGVERTVAPPGRDRPAHSSHPAPPRALRVNEVDGSIPPARQRILDALAWLESVGIPSADRTQLAMLSDQSPTSSSYQLHLSGLRGQGLIDSGPRGLTLTADGRARAAEPEATPTTASLQAAIMRKLPPARARILAALIRVYPEGLARDALADLAGQSATSSSYQLHLSALRALGIIDKRDGEVVALPVLFLEGR